MREPNPADLATIALQDAIDVIELQIKSLEQLRASTIAGGRRAGVSDAIVHMRYNIEEARKAMAELIQRHYPALHQLAEEDNENRQN